MACDCNSEIYSAKELLRAEMREGFKENSACHADLKDQISAVNVRVVRIEDYNNNKDSNEKYVKGMLWSILGSVLSMVVIGVLTLVFKS